MNQIVTPKLSIYKVGVTICWHTDTVFSSIDMYGLCPLLLTWFNFNPSMDE